MWHVDLKAKSAQRSLGDHIPKAAPQRPDFTRQRKQGEERKATAFLLASKGVFWHNGSPDSLAENMVQKLLPYKVNAQGEVEHKRILFTNVQGLRGGQKLTQKDVD